MIPPARSLRSEFLFISINNRVRFLVLYQHVVVTVNFTSVFAKAKNINFAFGFQTFNDAFQPRSIYHSFSSAVMECFLVQHSGVPAQPLKQQSCNEESLLCFSTLKLVEKFITRPLEPSECLYMLQVDAWVS